MKNQNDLILLISALVVMLGGVLAFAFTAPKPLPPAAPEAVVTTPATAPQASVVYSNSLPGGGSGSGASGGGRTMSVPGAAGGGSPVGSSITIAGSNDRGPGAAGRR